MNPSPAAVIPNVSFRSARRHLLFLGAVVLTAGFSYAGEGKILSGNFEEGDLDGWTTPGKVVAISGEGLKSSAPVGYISRRLEHSTADEGKLVFKANVWPKGEDASWIMIGFFPKQENTASGGLQVLIRPANNPHGGGTLFSGPGTSPKEGGNPSGLLKVFKLSDIGNPPYSVELAYSTTPPSVTVTINGEVVAQDLPTAYEGVAGSPPPPEAFAFAGIVFFQQNETEGGGRVQNAAVEWIPAH